MTCLLYWLTGFRGEDIKAFFPIGSYVKIMSAEGSHLGLRSESPDTILKIDHLRTIHAIFALKCLTSFRGEDLKKNISHRFLC
jgi:hypothetical protein